MWLGEQITAHGVGNGISILIFAGIVAAVPNGVTQLISQYFVNAGDELFINIIIVTIHFTCCNCGNGWCYIRKPSTA